MNEFKRMRQMNAQTNEPRKNTRFFEDLPHSFEDSLEFKRMRQMNAQKNAQKNKTSNKRTKNSKHGPS